ncbi:hypothetical protein GE09DRAFT_1166302 [Coniochaeta sp. 2T2.1]|nr:hypothetical protein GE09DRAFT_1166302 [Coniochaeta sp. 2T2.1]
MENDARMAFIQRFQALQVYRDSYTELAKDLILYNERTTTDLAVQIEDLQRQLHISQLDLTDATNSRRELQLEVQNLTTAFSALNQHLQVLQSHNPYVVVLIDGDGLLFKDHFIRKGVEGGKKAALALKTAILKQCHGLATEIEVIGRVYVNLAGLTEAMRKSGSLEKESDLKNFSLGFTQGVSSFDFIDVGSDRPDAKIKDSATWHLRNYNCKHVILGISHDAGYAAFVNGVMANAATEERVTVLEGTRTVHELLVTGVSVLSLNDTLFRSEKLVAKPPPKGQTLLSPIGSPRPALIAAVTPRPASTPATAEEQPVSYARAIKKAATPPPQMTLPIPLQPKKTNGTREASKEKKAAPPPWNPGRRGLDPTLKVEPEALERIKKRKDHNKLCNNHYLRGPCSKGNDCVFEHKYKPTEDEIVAIAFLTRLNPCTSGQDCEIENCIYGHHCPTIKDNVCMHGYCKFRSEDHPPGCKLRKPSQSYDDY